MYEHAVRLFEIVDSMEELGGGSDEIKDGIREAKLGVVALRHGSDALTCQTSSELHKFILSVEEQVASAMWPEALAAFRAAQIGPPFTAQYQLLSWLKGCRHKMLAPRSIVNGFEDAVDNATAQTPTRRFLCILRVLANANKRSYVVDGR